MARLKLTEELVLAVYNDKGTLREVGARHGVSHQTVANIRQGKVGAQWTGADRSTEVCA